MNNKQTNDGMKEDLEEIIECLCGHLLCVTKVWQYKDDPSDEVYISYIITIKGFWRRIKFLFKGVHTQETITTAKRFKEIADKIDPKTVYNGK